MAEDFLLKLIEAGNLAAIHCRRKTIQLKDFKLVDLHLTILYFEWRMKSAIAFRLFDTCLITNRSAMVRASRISTHTKRGNMSLEIGAVGKGCWQASV